MNLLFEVVLIKLDDRVRLYRLHTDTAVDHEICETHPVDQDHAGVNRPRILDGLAREGTSSYKDALIGLLSMKRANEALHLWSPDGIVGRIPLGLHIDPSQAEGILVDHTIDSAVISATDSTSPLLDTAVAHRYQHVQDGLLEEVGTRGSQSFEQLGGERASASARASDDIAQLIRFRKRS
jgi:hypothetical protein